MDGLRPRAPRVGQVGLAGRRRNSPPQTAAGRAGTRRHPLTVYLGRTAAIALAYFGAAQLGLELAFGESTASAVWPPAGIALAALVIWGPRMWPGVLLGALVAEATSGVPLVTALGITAGNTLEALLGAYLLVRVARLEPALARVRDVVALTVAAAISTAAGATAGFASLWLGGVIPFAAVVEVWSTWWLGDVGGVLIVAPFLLVLGVRPAIARRQRDLLTAAGVLALLVAACVPAFSSSPGLEYLVFPVLILAALRFHALGAAATSIFVAGVSVSFAARGLGPFAGGSVGEGVLRSQLFVTVMSLGGLMLAAVVAERAAALRALEQAHGELEGKVGARTAALTKSEAGLADAQGLAQIGSWEWDIETGEETWSEELFRIFGVDPRAFEPTYAAYIDRVHPDDRDLVAARHSDALRDGGRVAFDQRVVRPDGTVRILATRGEVVSDDDGRPLRIRGVCQDVTERKRTEATLAEANAHLLVLATSDALTGLANRALFFDRLERGVAFARRREWQVAVLFVDLDAFKVANDRYGHHAGDEILLEAARRLRAAVRESDTVARLGGDEFAVLLAGDSAGSDATATAERVLACFRRPLHGAAAQPFLSASIGAATLPAARCGERGQELLQQADAAMYRAKGAGGNGLEVFAPDVAPVAPARL